MTGDGRISSEDSRTSMVVFRCTQRVVRRFRLTPTDAKVVSSGMLGDSYANLLNFGPRRYVLCQSERSLLPVILPARNALFPAGFGETLGRVLLELGVPPEAANREVAAAREVRFTRTRSRQILGTMNDFAYNAQVYLSYAKAVDPTLEVCLKLAEMPSKPIGYEAPGEVALSLLRSPRVN